MKTLLQTNISTCFRVKYKTKFEHNHDVVYHGTCLETDGPENYIGQTA